MGGMIAQHLALHHASRVLSLALIYSTPSVAFVHGLDLLAGRLDAPSPRNRTEAVELFVQNEAASSSSHYARDLGWLRELGGLMYDRCHDPDGVARQTRALQTADDLTPLLRRIDTPTTVVDGSDDRLIAPAASTVLHALIAGSGLTIHPGMGHELPRPLWKSFVDQIWRNSRSPTLSPSWCRPGPARPSA